MKLALIVQSAGPMKGKKIPITTPTFTIGRDKSCSLEAGSSALAPVHCALEIRDDAVYLRDLDTDAGTLINDQRITGEVEIKNGDEFKAGPLHFAVSITGKPKPKPAPVVLDPSAAEVTLVVKIAGPMEGKKLVVVPPIFTIGRAPQCSLQAGSPTISDTHCAIEIRGEKVFVRDLESATGTFLGEYRITHEMQVRDGDTLRVGPLIFQLSIKPPKVAAPAPAPSSNTSASPKAASKPERRGAASTAAQDLLRKYLQTRRD